MRFSVALRSDGQRDAVGDIQQAAVLECFAQMESNLLGMKQICDYVGHGLGRVMLEALIEEAESQIAEIKRKLSQ